MNKMKKIFATLFFISIFLGLAPLALATHYCYKLVGDKAATYFPGTAEDPVDTDADGSNNANYHYAESDFDTESERTANAGKQVGDPKPIFGPNKFCREPQQGQGLTALNAANKAASNTIVSEILGVFTGSGNGSKIFLWAIGIGAIMAFGVITYSGVIWSLSGISEEKSHAKEWIFGAIQGLILLIVAYVILFIINPQLVTL